MLIDVGIALSWLAMSAAGALGLSSLARRLAGDARGEADAQLAEWELEAHRALDAAHA